MEHNSKATLYAPTPAQRAASRNHDRNSHIDLGSVALGRTTSEISGHADEVLGAEKKSNATRGYFVQSRVPHKERADASRRAQDIPGNVQRAVRARESGYVMTQHASPWKIYEKGYELKLDQFVTVAHRKAPLQGKVVIRNFVEPDANRKLDMVRRIRHRRFVDLLEIFEFEKTWYAVFEHIVMSLVQLVNSPAYPNEKQLAAVVGQVSQNPGLCSYHVAYDDRFLKVSPTLPRKDFDMAS